jgi:transposase InsO family protein
MVYQFMRENRRGYTIKETAGLFGVSCGAYYKWVKHGLSERKTKADTVLVSLILKIVLKHHYRYGSPRVREELRQKHGIRVSLKKIARLMRENGLNARRKGKFVKTTQSKHNLPVCENILNREFDAESGGQKWVSDITYLRTLSGWLYLTVIIDLFDRKIIGWSFSTCLDTEHTTAAALLMAVKNRTPGHGLIFHSDRGIQYCSKLFCDRLRERCPTVRQSMSRKGNCWDNACAETFFKTLKVELETLEGKHSMAEVKQSVFMYIEGYYNCVRLHSTLDYIAPNVFYLEQAA